MGIDLGTQSVKVLAVADDGRVLREGRAPLSSVRDGVRHEQDPQAWWGAVRDAARAAGDLSDAEALAVCGTSGTIVLTDAAGAPVSPGIMYDDARGAEVVSEVNAVGAEVWAELGYGSMQSSWALPTFVAMLRDRDDAHRIRLSHQADFIVARLAGHPVPADLSNALKSGADAIRGRWPSSVMAALGVPQEVLPGLIRPGDVVATVSSSAAEATGLPVGIPIIAGMTDGCAAQLGAGAVAPGDWNSTLGTTLVLKGATAELVRDPGGGAYSHPAPAGGWFLGGASSSGAGVLSRVLPGADLGELTVQAQLLPRRTVGYPLSSERGERFPFVASAATAFWGVSGDAALFDSMLRGCAAIERLCFDYLDLLGAPVDGRVTITGGATANEYWNRLRATTLGRPVAIPASTEAAMGMAVLAAAATRGLAAASADMVVLDQTIYPDDDPTVLDGYLTLIDELERRDWLPPTTAAHARLRAAA